MAAGEVEFPEDARRDLPSFGEIHGKRRTIVRENSWALRLPLQQPFRRVGRGREQVVAELMRQRPSESAAEQPVPFGVPSSARSRRPLRATAP